MREAYLDAVQEIPVFCPGPNVWPRHLALYHEGVCRSALKKAAAAEYVCLQSCASWSTPFPASRRVQMLFALRSGAALPHSLLSFYSASCFRCFRQARRQCVRLQMHSFFYRNFDGDSPLSRLSGHARESAEMAALLAAAENSEFGGLRQFVCIDEYGKGTEDMHASALCCAALLALDAVSPCVPTLPPLTGVPTLLTGVPTLPPLMFGKPLLNDFPRFDPVQLQKRSHCRGTGCFASIYRFARRYGTASCCTCGVPVLWLLRPTNRPPVEKCAWGSCHWFLIPICHRAFCSP